MAGGYLLGLLQQQGQGVHILEEDTYGVSDIAEQGSAIELVAGVAVLIGLSLIPVVGHIAVGLLVGEVDGVLAGRAIGHADGIFQQIDTLIGSEPLHQWSICVRGKVVVGIDKGDIVALSRLDAGIAGVAEAAVRLVDHADAAVLFCPLVAALRAAVWRAVIDEDNVEVGTSLADHAFDASVKRSLHTIDGYDDTQFTHF